MIKDAVFSDDNLCRYQLTRIWNEKEDNLLAFIMLNPSTAGKESDDPTVKRCIGFGVDLGYDGIVIVNLFPWRATSPKDIEKISAAYLKKNMFDDNTYPEIINEGAWLKNIFIDPKVKTIICGWSNIQVNEKWQKEIIVKRLAIKYEKNLYCLKYNQNGTPAHPLYLKADAKPVIYFSWIY